MEQMEETIRKQEESFKTLIDSPARGKLPLAVFSKNFFPMFIEYFAGKLEPNLNYWFTETGTNGYQPVDVLDTQGEVVFTVPPLFESTSAHFIGRSGINPAEHMALVQIKDKAIPGSGTQHANRVFEEIAKTEKPDDAQVKEFFTEWVKILNYYGYEATGETDSQSQTGSEMQTLGEDDIDGYDDL